MQSLHGLTAEHDSAIYVSTTQSSRRFRDGRSQRKHSSPHGGMGTSSQLSLRRLCALGLYISPAYLVAECCRVYGGPPARYPNWTIPDRTLRPHSCNNNREVAPELREVMFDFPTFSSCHTKHSRLLYYATIDECHSIVAIWFRGREITPCLFQFSSGPGYLVVPLE